MPAGALRVVTLNLWSRLGPWDRRKAEAGAWLRNLDADVVLLQEVVRQRDGLTSAEEVGVAAGGTWFSAFSGGGVPAWTGETDADSWGVAVLSRHRIEEQHGRRLPDQDDGKPNHLLHVRTTGVDVFSVHLAAPPTAVVARQRQVLAIDDAVKELAHADAALPPVFGGDFNADHDSDEIRFLSGLCLLEGRGTAYVNAMRVAGPRPTPWTLDGANPYLAPLNVHDRQVDFMFVGDAFMRERGTGRVLSADLAFHRSLTGCLASDHYGLVVDIGWPGRTTP